MELKRELKILIYRHKRPWRCSRIHQEEIDGMTGAHTIAGVDAFLQSLNPSSGSKDS
ncbi:hypothetical protein BT96DRAFT_615994 [Gymnopus androsaceus JB14]|uniref:Uncharacterized protein n=1 Tax=Gymnopus androsaceus JB14 TaxID=1447944 RepID=A0A6A4HPU2_9AGAR|nr:hypothetical protein BT96DRAFT_615994 [Gymnopus androsaceus JB14]